MADEKKWFSTFAGGSFIGVLIFAVAYFALEWFNKIFSSAENVNPLLLPKMHLAVLALNIILFRVLIRKVKTENTAKGILFVSFLYMIVYFIFLNK